jgi:DNA-binding response OmpR family regulator
VKILLVEDETKLAAAVRKMLVRQGYAVDVAADGPEGLAYAGSYVYDLILLDLMLPGLDGYGVIRTLRSRNVQTPILVLTAKDDVEDKIRGLDLGADDYVTKPFDAGELLARIRAMLRREPSEAKVFLTAGDLVLDPRTRSVRRRDRPISLTAREYALLEFMLRRKNRVLTRDEIIERVWDCTFDGFANIVDVYIRYLRRKIDVGHSLKLIRTVRGVGYMLGDDEIA